jgi:hypothetical protein
MQPDDARLPVRAVAGTLADPRVDSPLPYRLQISPHTDTTTERGSTT